MELIILFIFTIVIMVLGTVILSFGFFYKNLIQKLHQVQKQNLYLRFHVQEKSLQKINTAKDTSLQIITQATKQAEEILKQAEALKTDTNEQAKRELEILTNKQKGALTAASDQLLNLFNDTVKHLEDKDIELFGNITKNIEDVAVSEVKTFEKRLHDETVGQQQVIDEKVREAYAKAQAEIVEYKKNKISSFDQEVSILLQKITKEIIGKSLTIEDHRELIRKSLERAKAEIIDVK